MKNKRVLNIQKLRKHKTILNTQQYEHTTPHRLNMQKIQTFKHKHINYTLYTNNTKTKHIHHKKTNTTYTSYKK